MAIFKYLCAMNYVVRRIFSLIITLTPAICLHAQEGADGDSVPVETPALHTDVPGAWHPLGRTYGALFMPSMAFGCWDLHEGMNLQMEAGVRVGWGKHNPWKGASFFSNVGAMYALPLSRDGRWTAALGGYYSNFRLWRQQMNSVGLMGMVDYTINDRLDIAGFVAHDFGVIGGGHPRRGPLLPFLENPSTTVGAGLGIKLSDNAFMRLSVSVTREHNGQPVYGGPVKTFKE